MRRGTALMLLLLLNADGLLLPGRRRYYSHGSLPTEYGRISTIALPIDVTSTRLYKRTPGAGLYLAAAVMSCSFRPRN